MPQFTSDDIGKVVSFTVYPAAIIGTAFSRVRILGIVDADTVRVFGRDPAALHANVFPTLPVGTPNNYRAYSYLKVKLPSGQDEFVGLPWINIGTIAIHANTQYRVDVFDANAGDAQAIREALVMRGFNNIVITPVDPV